MTEIEPEIEIVTEIAMGGLPVERLHAGLLADPNEKGNMPWLLGRHAQSMLRCKI